MYTASPLSETYTMAALQKKAVDQFVGWLEETKPDIKGPQPDTKMTEIAHSLIPDNVFDVLSLLNNEVWLFTESAENGEDTIEGILHEVVETEIITGDFGLLEAWDAYVAVNDGSLEDDGDDD